MSEIAIVMGSKSDLISLKGAFDTLNSFKIGFTARVISAHRTPDAAADFAKHAEAEGFRVIICAAGMAAHLAGVIAGLVEAPVIAVPTSVGYGASFEGLAPLLTMLNSCAEGVSVVNIDNGFGAGIIACRMLRMATRKTANGQ